MFPQATDGSLYNNDRFSSCSQGYISDNLLNKASCLESYSPFSSDVIMDSVCFVTETNVCGNGIVEPGEPWYNLHPIYGVHTHILATVAMSAPRPSAVSRIAPCLTSMNAVLRLAVAMSL